MDYMEDWASTSDFQLTAGHLVPVISTNTLRYDRFRFRYIEPYYQVVNAGRVPIQAPSIPSSWRRLVHPEGQPYYALTGAFQFAVITAANIEVAQTERQILDYAKLARKKLQHHDIRLPPESELVLELADDGLSCNYYFVDHASKTLFWLTDVDTELLGIPPAVSLSHLDSMLQAYYWVYVEYFPMHHESRQKDFTQCVDDLYNIISHGQADRVQIDRLTSKTSTFPYSADMCERFSKLLLTKRGQSIDGYTLCFAARITGAIMNQRFNTYYGHEFAQLDRQQYIVDSGGQERLWATANLLMWRIPWYYNNLLEDLYANGSVSDQWTHFLSLCRVNWTGSLLCSLPVLMVGILLAVAEGTISATAPLTLSSMMSIAFASCLLLWHHSFTEASPSDGVQYIRLAKSSNTGFLLLAVTFSLPQASYLWSVLLLIVQFLLIIYHKGSKLVVMVVAAIIVFIFGLLWQVAFPGETTPMSLFWTFVGLFMPRLHSLDEGGEYSVV